MIINITSDKLYKALEETNKLFNNNLQFNNFQRLSDTRYRVTLRVKDSHGSGARLGFPGFGKQRHLVSACWHVHGVFFDSLPKGTKIITRGNTTHAGDTWKDFDIGSIVHPYLMSEACDC